MLEADNKEKGGLALQGQAELQARLEAHPLLGSDTLVGSDSPPLPGDGGTRGLPGLTENQRPAHESLEPQKESTTLPVLS